MNGQILWKAPCRPLFFQKAFKNVFAPIFIPFILTFFSNPPITCHSVSLGVQEPGRVCFCCLSCQEFQTSPVQRKPLYLQWDLSKVRFPIVIWPKWVTVTPTAITLLQNTCRLMPLLRDDISLAVQIFPLTCIFCNIIFLLFSMAYCTFLWFLFFPVFSNYSCNTCKKKVHNCQVLL